MFVANYMNISATPYCLHCAGFASSKQEVIKMTSYGGPGQLAGTSYLGHCKTEITGSNPATCMSALNSVINACPVNEPMEDARGEEEG